jgi:hypothetical protein
VVVPVAALDVVELDGAGDAGQRVEPPRVGEEARIVGEALEVAAQRPVVGEVEPDQALRQRIL